MGHGRRALIGIPLLGLRAGPMQFLAGTWAG